MPEAMKIQEPIEKAGETASLPDVVPCREYGKKDNWYSLMAQLFHTPSVLDSLPDAWCLMMKANRAHLVIMLREAGAGHDPFGNSEWSSTPTQVWENLAKVEQLPNLDGADLSGLDPGTSSPTGAASSAPNGASAAAPDAALQRRRPRLEPAQRLEFHLQSLRHHIRPQLLQQKVQTAPAGALPFLSGQHAFHLPAGAY